jgi:hypothetical protein
MCPQQNAGEVFPPAIVLDRNMRACFHRGMAAGALSKVNWLFVLCLLLVAGCGTFDSRNAESRPWNRPTKAEESQHWIMRDGWDSLTDYP